MPGDKTTEYGTVATDDLKRRFPAEWLAFSKGDVAAINGTPLNNLATLPSRLALEMQATGIRTVEDLAGLSDGNVKNFQGGTIWRKKAREFLANQAPNETEALKDEVQTLRAQMAEMMEMMRANQSGPSAPVERKKPGPKPKTEDQQAA